MNISDIFSITMKEHKEFNNKRNSIILLANNLLKKSKQTIFALHRDDIKVATGLLKENIIQINEIYKVIGDDEYLLHQIGVLGVALEEFMESLFFYNYITGEDFDVIEKNTQRFGFEVYLGALCDYTGELTRDVYRKAEVDKLKYVEKVRDIIDDIVGGLLEFDLTGKLRSKIEDAKRNLKRVEGVVYDLNLKS